MRLIPIKNISEYLPVKPATLYKYSRTGTYPQIFKRFGGRVLVDLDEVKAILNDQSMNQNCNGATNGDM
jgi:predicted site-specific integrase-resolvase